ncbi:MAG TPA: S1/P1 nuclease [Tepidisphaeraceae bacterium]|jgi:hypothetical protein
MKQAFALASLLLVLTLSAPPAGAWGRDGHVIVARIAELNLTEPARARIAELLDVDGAQAPTSIADDAIANWADLVKKLNATAPWHYIDIPIRLDPDKRLSPQQLADLLEKEDAIVYRIEDLRALFADARANDKERLRALKYLVHFVADVHQPLHCANYNDDRGGNDRKLNYFRPLKPFEANLHFFWDDLILQQALGIEHTPAQVLDYAAKLNAAITDEQRHDWLQRRTATQWALESNALADAEAYDIVPASKDTKLDITEAYVKSKVPVMNTQLQKAGLRLADLLNTALSQDPDARHRAPAIGVPASAPTR